MFQFGSEAENKLLTGLLIRGHFVDKFYQDPTISETREVDILYIIFSTTWKTWIRDGLKSFLWTVVLNSES